MRSNLILKKTFTFFSFRFICGKNVGGFSSRHPSCFLLPSLLPPFRSKPLSLSHTHTTERRKRRGKGAPPFFSPLLHSFPPFLRGRREKEGGGSTHIVQEMEVHPLTKKEKKEKLGGREVCIDRNPLLSHVRSPFFSFHFFFFAKSPFLFPHKNGEQQGGGKKNTKKGFLRRSPRHIFSRETAVLLAPLILLILWYIAAVLFWYRVFDGKGIFVALPRPPLSLLFPSFSRNNPFFVHPGSLSLLLLTQWWRRRHRRHPLWHEK